MIVHFSATAFLTMALSAVEAYKKECYGLILGHRTDQQWRVEFAVPYLTATRGHKMVTPHSVRDQRVRACLAQLSDYEMLGTFHSHPAWGHLRALARPSLQDRQSMQPGEIEVIVAVNDARRPRRFHHGERGRILTGTVCNFALTFAAFYKPPLGENLIRRLPVRCPYAIGFDPDIALK